MADGFVGRRRELALLDDLFTQVRDGGRTGRPGRALLVRGRRRVGKSRLAEEFCDRAGCPTFFFTATGGPPALDLAAFATDLAGSSLPDAALATGPPPGTWEAALTLMARAVPVDRPSIVVLDELPYLVRADPAFEGALQKVFDRLLSRVPVLLVLIGSDIGMMEELNSYGRPFHQRGTELVVPPLDPAAVASMLDLPPADALDAHLVTGGLPLVLQEWPHGADLWGFLADALTRPTSALLVSGERALTAEFPSEGRARTVLGAIGHGERSFTTIARDAGGMPPSTLHRALDLLTGRRIVRVENPLSTATSTRLARYRIEDPYLRFWLSFVGPGIAEVERGRGDVVLSRIRQGWTNWRGRAVEPVVREALWRLADDVLPPGTGALGGYWTRSNDPEIDIVAADRAPVARTITAVGSVKWHERSPFDGRDLARLSRHRDQLPGADPGTDLIAVSRTGWDVPGVRPGGTSIRLVGPDLLVSAWEG